MSTRLYIILPVSCFILVSYNSVAQVAKVSLQQAIQQSLQNNSSARAARYDVAGQQTLKASATQVEKLSGTGMFGQYNSYATADNNITISQSIPFPSVFTAKSSLGNAHIKSSELKRDATENNIAYQVKSVWYRLAYLHALNAWYVRQDSLLMAFAEASSVRHRTGETTLLEKVTAESRYLQGKTLLLQNEADIAIARKRLQMLMNTATPVDLQAGQRRDRADRGEVAQRRQRVEMQRGQLGQLRQRREVVDLRAADQVQLSERARRERR
jgi:cobalt-zinc-cadmium resistance protein CzcA